METGTIMRPAVGHIKHWLTAGLALAGVASLLVVPQIARSLTSFSLHEVADIDLKLKYQMITVGMTLVYLLILRQLHPQTFSQFARRGDSDAHPQPVGWLSIKASDTWRGVGRNFAVVITVVTAIFIFQGVLAGKLPDGSVLRWLPLVLILAACNAFVEEALTRFGIVVSLYGVIPNTAIYWVSALVFGVPHFFGVPGGVIGMAMAGFLGWLLARSVVETRGVFWAWLIHFLQDVVIFFGLLAVLPTG